MNVTAIIVAAGKGMRAGSQLPKQFHNIHKRPLLYYTLSKFQECSLVNAVLVVVPQDWLEFVRQKVVERYGLTKVSRLVVGGVERQDSVYAGLQVLGENVDFVVIHDSVRPFVCVSKIEKVISESRKFGAAILAVPPRDTIKSATENDRWLVHATLQRDILWSVQTPQAFRYDILMEAYKAAFEAGIYATDDSALVERIGKKVKIVEGDYNNIKVTVPADFRFAELYLERAEN